jgi:DNA-binding NarL/FixJ family response regulator
MVMGNEAIGAAGRGGGAAAWKRRLLLVEDEPLLASLMLEVLRAAGFEVAHAASAVEARALIDDLDPDAALVDVHLGSGPSGLHLGHVLARTHPHVGVLLLSRFADLSAAGLDGFALPPGSVFIPKDRIVDMDVLIGAVDAVLAGRPGPAVDDRVLGPLEGLTRAQLAVLRLAASGLSNAAIAARRGTSERSVEQHLQAVYVALDIELGGDLNPRVEAVRRYVEVAGLPVGAHEPPVVDDAGDWGASGIDPAVPDARGGPVADGVR